MHYAGALWGRSLLERAEVLLERFLVGRILVVGQLALRHLDNDRRL